MSKMTTHQPIVDIDLLADVFEDSLVLSKTEPKNEKKTKKKLSLDMFIETNSETPIIQDVEPIVEPIVEPTETDRIYEYVLSFVEKHPEHPIVLLKNREVIQWLLGDLSFLPPIESKNKTTDEPKLKILEDKWGQLMLKNRRPDLKLDKQWTNKFGEHLCEEIHMISGKQFYKPVKKEHYQPDSEVDDAIWEVKAGTFFTSGTAGEKILGCPFKYAEIPDLYSKPLKILCMGGAEKICREQYGNISGPKTTPQKQKFLDFFKLNHIEYVATTDILKSWIIN
jgi:hypothetical protein